MHGRGEGMEEMYSYVKERMCTLNNFSTNVHNEEYSTMHTLHPTQHSNTHTHTHVPLPPLTFLYGGSHVRSSDPLIHTALNAIPSVLDQVIFNLLHLINLQLFCLYISMPCYDNAEQYELVRITRELRDWN